MDISQGGGISSAADVEIDILNQDRKDTTILTAPNRLEYRPVTIYMGYIPAGASPEVEITTGLLQMWTGVVDDVLDFDYGHFRLACTDEVFLRHKEIPLTIIEETAYPDAPKENIGKPLPMVYGAFYDPSATVGGFTFADEEKAWITERLFPVPCIKIADVDEQFAIADHAIHTLKSVWVSGGDNGLSGKLYVSGAAYGAGNEYAGSAAPSSSVITGPSTFKLEGDYVAYFRQLAKKRGTRTSAGVTIAEFKTTIDEDFDTTLSLGPAEKVAYQLIRPVSIGQFVAVDVSVGNVDFNFRVFFGTVTGSGAYETYYWNGTSETLATSGTVTSDSRLNTNFDIPTLDLDTLSNYQWIFKNNSGGIMAIDHVYLEYSMRVGNQGKK